MLSGDYNSPRRCSSFNPRYEAKCTSGLLLTSPPFFYFELRLRTLNNYPHQVRHHFSSIHSCLHTQRLSSIAWRRNRKTLMGTRNLRSGLSWPTSAFSTPPSCHQRFLSQKRPATVWRTQQNRDCDSFLSVVSHSHTHTRFKSFLSFFKVLSLWYFFLRGRRRAEGEDARNVWKTRQGDGPQRGEIVIGFLSNDD